MEEESLGRNRGGNHGGGIMEDASWRNRGSPKEAARRQPGDTQETPRRHPGGTHLRFSPLSRLSKRLIKKLSNNSSNSNSNRLLVTIVPA